jgi:hypothetical protein
MAIEVLTVNREEKEVRLFVEGFTLCFALVGEEVRLIGKSVLKQCLSSFDDLFIPPGIYQQAFKVAYAILYGGEGKRVRQLELDLG